MGVRNVQPKRSNYVTRATQYTGPVGGAWETAGAPVFVGAVDGFCVRYEIVLYSVPDEQVEFFDEANKAQQYHTDEALDARGVEVLDVVSVRRLSASGQRC
ncbi:hypothetical protein SUDANB95_01853 [Actinosynnema sp. ALI-1.44]